MLNLWLNCTYVIAKGVDRGIVSLERMSAIVRVCHGQEGAAEKFFYMYMCHFSQLHVRLPLDDFTMGSLYLRPSPHAFLYFYDTRPRQPTTWLSLVSRSSISRLDAFSQSFEHFKDGYFKVVVKEEGKSHFLNVDGSTQFLFSWTGSPSRYKDMGTNELPAADREVVEVLMKFIDKLPTKGLVRVYNSVHPIIDIEGHMAQAGKKNLTFFQALRKERAVKAKTAGNTEVPNLQELLVEVHVHGGTKRKVELPARPGKGKDRKKVSATLLGQGSSSGAKGPEVGLIELLETAVRKDIAINLPEIVINSTDNMEPDHLVRTMIEFGSKALILSRQVGSLYRREVKEGNREKVEELQEKVDKFAEERAAWKKEREGWEEVKKRLGTWKVRCLDSKSVEVVLEDLKGCIIQEHTNGFQNGVRQAAFFCQDIDATDTIFDVNKDVVDGQLVNEVESSPEEEAEKGATGEDKDAKDVVEGDDNKAA
ncbi:hypothetical protein DEO72_LG8g1275 [Vigna unguiculata]|uniref:Uncharacterized protein n=1 Tax=Vigna unguiculata TaxID=3917 RepID=A0A4D6MRJ7_VIGUN|nr:hypothetical protein DEO72_LG8g1275 [Vigna unguiculata]